MLLASAQLHFESQLEQLTKAIHDQVEVLQWQVGALYSHMGNPVLQDPDFSAIPASQLASQQRVGLQNLLDGETIERLAKPGNDKQSGDLDVELDRIQSITLKKYAFNRIQESSRWAWSVCGYRLNDPNKLEQHGGACRIRPSNCLKC